VKDQIVCFFHKKWGFRGLIVIANSLIVLGGGLIVMENSIIVLLMSC
jgi:hypothetical protein